MLLPLRRCALSAALVLAVRTVPSYGAYVGTSVGSGTISPGLTQVPTFQNITATLDVVTLVGTNGATVVASGCRFTGSSSIAETELAGRGSGTLDSCVGASITGSLLYSRQGLLLTMSGNLLINGSQMPRGPMSLHCEVAPTSANPVSTYSVHCTWS